MGNLWSKTALIKANWGSFRYMCRNQPIFGGHHKEKIPACLIHTDLVFVEIGDDWIVLLPVLGLHELQDAVEVLPVLQKSTKVYNILHCGIHSTLPGRGLLRRPQWLCQSTLVSSPSLLFPLPLPLPLPLSPPQSLLLVNTQYTSLVYKLHQIHGANGKGITHKSQNFCC